MTRRQQTFLIAACIVAVLLCAALYPFCVAQGISYAAERSYSNVLDDLKKDTSFDMSYYPDNAADNSLQVITIAESEDDELFVYVYQPSAKTRPLTATYINISTDNEHLASFDYVQYALRLLSREGVFAKYLVEGLTVKPDSTRYYYISNILRPWDKDLDEAAPGDNTISQTPNKVAKVWEFGELNGKSYVNVREVDTIEITSKYCGFVRYPDGFNLYVGACDSHFVAFDTDRPIDQLLRAKVTFYKQEYSSSTVAFGGTKQTFGDVVYEHGLWVDSQECSYGGKGLFAGSYTWNRIQSIDEFISSVNFEQQVYSGALINVSVASKLSKEAEDNIKNQKWVLRFLETSYELNSGMGSYTTFSTIVGDVEILQLEFLYQGKPYNLGVVDNKQSGDPFDPVNDTNYTIEMAGWIKDIWNIIKKVLLALLIIFVLLVVIWVVSKIVGIFKRPKVVIKGDKKKKKKE